MAGFESRARRPAGLCRRAPGSREGDSDWKGKRWRDKRHRRGSTVLVAVETKHERV